MSRVFVDEDDKEEKVSALRGATFIEDENKDDREIKRDESNILFVQESLDRAQQLNDSMLAILDSFENRLSLLENTMLPIHRHTQSWTAAKNNIDATLKEIEAVIEHHKITTETDESLRERLNILADLPGYLAWADKLTESLHFFTQNENFKSADKATRRLRELSKRATLDCRADFERVLKEYSNKPLDLKKYPWPLPENFELIPASMVNRLGRLAEMLDNLSDADNYFDFIASCRGDFLKATLKKALPSENKESKGGEEDEKTARYVKGSHKFIHYIRVFLRLIEMEKQLIADILAFTNMGLPEIDAVFVASIDAPLRHFLSRFDDIIREKYSNKVLIIFDILHNFQQLMPQFEAVLQKAPTENSHIARVANLIEQLAGAARRSIVEHRDNLLNHYDKKLAPDGAICTLTIETMSFIKRLLEYRSSIEHTMKMSSLSISLSNDLREFSAPTVMGSAILYLIHALEQNLKTKASSYKNASLSYIFLLNNYFYISKQIKSEDLMRLVGTAFITDYERRIVKTKNEYRQVSWERALSYLDLSDYLQMVNNNKAIKNKFAGFNEAFEELYNSQKHFSVPDPDLRSQIRADNVQLVSPLYTQFHDTYKEFAFSKHPGKYIKYPPKVLEDMLNKFFDEEA